MKYLLVILFFPCLVQAYTAKDINLSDYGFNRYVRPQLISIGHDYLTLITTMNPELKHLKPFNGILKKIEKKFTIIKRAYQIDKMEQAAEETEQSLKLLRDGLKLLAKHPDFTKKEHFSPESVLLSYQEFNQFREFFFQLYNHYENMYFFISANIKNDLSILQIESDFNTAYNMFNILLIKSSDDRFHPEFLSFWNNFIKPVNSLILPRNDKDLFIAKLNEFNLRLNILNIVLTKRNKKITKQTATILKIIHNRWVSVLKVTLRR